MCDPYSGKCFGEAIVGRTHDVGVKGPRHGQRHGFHGTQGRRQFRGPLAGPVGPGNDNVVRAEEIGDLQNLPPAGLVAECLDLDPFQAEDADHAAGRGVGGGLHSRPALLHQHQPGLEFHGSGKNHGRILAEAQPGRRLAAQHHVRRLGPQGFDRRKAGHKNGRLTADGRIELFGRPLETKSRQVVPEDFCGAVIEAPDTGKRLHPPPAHADELRALPGKQTARSSPR